METTFDLDQLFRKSELIPVIIQDVSSLEVLMLGFTNRELWNKGESSGHFLHVKKVVTDCDTDTLLYLCVPEGPTCHTGAQSCFFNEIWEEEP